MSLSVCTGFSASIVSDREVQTRIQTASTFPKKSKRPVGSHEKTWDYFFVSVPPVGRSGGLQFDVVLHLHGCEPSVPRGFGLSSKVFGFAI